jgi:hypothetical protein
MVNSIGNSGVQEGLMALPYFIVKFKATIIAEL